MRREIFSTQYSSTDKIVSELSIIILICVVEELVVEDCDDCGVLLLIMMGIAGM